MDTKELLTEARRLIDEGGWIQNAHTYNGKRCAYGAVDTIALRAGVDLRPAMDALHALAKERSDHTYGIIGYNDEPGRTKEEVLDLFDTAIDSLTTQEG